MALELIFHYAHESPMKYSLFNIGREARTMISLQSTYTLAVYFTPHAAGRPGQVAGPLGGEIKH